MSANPYTYLKAAARGDRDAQRAIADLAVKGFHEDPEPGLLLDGLNFARLAFANGEAEEDGGRLLQMLSLASLAHSRNEHAELRTELAAEMIAVATRCADSGSELVAAHLESLIAGTTPEAVRAGKLHLKAMNEMGE